MRNRLGLAGVLLLLCLVLIIGACGYKDTATGNPQSTSSSPSPGSQAVNDEDPNAEQTEHSPETDKAPDPEGGENTESKDGSPGKDLNTEKTEQLPGTDDAPAPDSKGNTEPADDKPVNSGNDQAVKKVSVNYANFKIKYLDDGCKLVTDGENRRLLLVPRGQTAPQGIIANQTIYIPLKDVMALSSTFVGAMVKLNVLDSLKAVSLSKNNWHIPQVKEAMSRGAIKYVGGDNMEPPDYELVKSIKPELSFVYTGAVGQRYIMRKFDELGIPYAVNNEWLETDYVGRMEWIKFTAAFYNKEAEAEKIFNAALNSINRTKAEIAGLPKPKVAWGLSWLGKVYVTNADSYVGKWITDCGGDYVFKDIGRGSDTQVSMENFYVLGKDADILIFSSTTNYMSDPTIRGIIKENPLFADIKAVKEGNVWAYAPDWWETIPETDVFVKDIAAVFHPEKYPGHKITKLIKLPHN